MTSKRQVTFPRHIVERLHLKEGETLHVSETPDGILIRPHRFDPKQLAPLRHLVPVDLPAPDLEEVRHAATQDPTLRA